MSKTDSSTFYSSLPILDSFFQVSKPVHYRSLPDDWLVGVSDIVNSTKAIENNKYKFVNILGASPIIGLLNISGKEELPFSFGGDGCVICFPPSLLKEAQTILAASKKIGSKEYDLDLRVSIVPMKDIRAKGLDVKVARFKASDHYNQAVFIGGGIKYAEDLLKEEAGKKYRVPTDINTDSADFSGLECRWKEVGAKNMSVYSLLVQALPGDKEVEYIYDEVFSLMQDIFGFDNKTNPIPVESLKMNLSPGKLAGEVKFRTFGQGFFKRLAYLLEIQVRIILGKIFMRFDHVSSETDWRLYKPDLSANNDHRKFDDMLRLVIAGTEEQYQRLEHFLHDKYQAGELVYGIHRSDTALITCMVFSWHRQHIHFIDGNNGGYVKAAKKLKKRLSKLEQSDQTLKN